MVSIPRPSGRTIADQLYCRFLCTASANAEGIYFNHGMQLYYSIVDVMYSLCNCHKYLLNHFTVHQHCNSVQLNTSKHP